MTSATIFFRGRFFARFRTQRLLVAHIPSHKNRNEMRLVLSFNWTILCYVKDTNSIV